MTDEEIKGRWTPKKIGLLVGLAAFLVFLCCGSLTALSIPGKLQEGYMLEHDLTAKYDDGRDALSKAIDEIAIAAGMSKQQADSMSQALAVSNDGTMAGAMASGDAKTFSTVIIRQQPDLTQYEAAFQRAFTTTIGVRENFSAAQREVIKANKAYKDWKSNPMNVATWVKHFPSNELTALGPDPQTGKTVTLKGDAAFHQIGLLVVNPGAQSGYNNGTYDFGNPYGNSGASSSPPPPVPSRSGR